jgi:Na+/pantothenate symporter
LKSSAVDRLPVGGVWPVDLRHAQRSTGSFLNEYFLGSRSMGGFVLAMTLTATYISASSFIGGPGAAYKYGLGWVLLAMIQLPPSGCRWGTGQKICHSGPSL